jgi:hypothetical protein
MDGRKSTALPSLLTTPELPSPTRLLRRREASWYLKNIHGVDCAPSTLAKLFCIGGGPCVRKIGRFPCYDPADLDEFALSKIGPRQRSSSDRGGAA